MKGQSTYLKDLKENLQSNVAIVLLDFAENYSFVIQDAVQGHHWDNSQATIHPFVIYYKENEELKCYNLAVISDSLKHDTTAVHCFISVVIPELKKIIGRAKRAPHWGVQSRFRMIYIYMYIYMSVCLVCQINCLGGIT